MIVPGKGKRSGETPTERVLRKVAEFEAKYYPYIIVVMIAITTVFALSLPLLKMETDFTKLMPQNMKSVKLEYDVRDVFGSTDTLFVLVELDGECKYPTDIKTIEDPRVVNYLLELSRGLKKDPSVRSVISIAMPFEFAGMVPYNQSLIEKVIQASGLENLINHDKTATLMLVRMDMGTSESSLKRSVQRVHELLGSVEKPPCVKYVVTGNLPMRYRILQLMVHDMVYTLSVAAAIIFVLLVLLRRSVTQAVLVFLPLIMGVVWTGGIFSLTGWELTIVTIGIGAMVLGLGVEYGVFMVERFEEEIRKGKDAREALLIALPSVGSSIMGSGITTIAGFLALLSVAFPMLSLLGIALATSIACMLIIAILFLPCLLMLESRLTEIFWKGGMR